MRRRDYISFLAIVAASRPIVAHPQHAGMPVVGVLGGGSPAAYAERLTLIRQSLAETGFTESPTVAIEYRWAEGQLDRLPSLANELVARGVNVVVATGGLQSVRAAMTAKNTIPIVFSADGDPVRQGLVFQSQPAKWQCDRHHSFQRIINGKTIDKTRRIAANIAKLPELAFNTDIASA